MIRVLAVMITAALALHGKVLQRLGSPGTMRYALGFTASGRKAWTSSTRGATAFYDVAP